MEAYGGAALTQAIDLGERTGLTVALAEGPATSEELAARAGCVERYVREWLGLMVTAGAVEHHDGTYTLPPEHAACLTGDAFLNTSGMARMLARGNLQTAALTEAFREGGGIRWGEELPETIGLMDAMGRARYDTFLVDHYLTVDDAITALLRTGGRLVDVGCGTGHATNLVARAFPEAEVTGLDRNLEAVAAARSEAESWGLSNVTFRVGDAADLDAGTADVVTTFDVIHDLARPSETLRSIHRCLDADGVFLMYDSGVPDDLDDQAQEVWAPMMYGVSLNACLTNSLADDGEGLGPMWGRGNATAALASAGFTVTSVHDVKGDPMSALYVARP